MNSYGYYEAALLQTWQTTAYVLAAGAPTEWMRNLRATTETCSKYTVIQANGDIEKINTSAYLKVVRITWRQSGKALVNKWAAKESGRAYVSVVLAEPIGNVLYKTQIDIFSDNEAQWARASALYNRLADSIAKVHGIQREPVDLLGGTEFTPNPDEYQAPTPPGSTIA